MDFSENSSEIWNTAYIGIDVVPEATAYGRDHLGLDLKTADYLEMKAPDTPFSDIFMWDVIEHLQYPGNFIHKAYSELRSGEGYILRQVI